MTDSIPTVHDSFCVERIFPRSPASVFVYRMAAGEMPLSVSLTTIEFAPWRDGTQLTFTEQGAFFAGPDSATGREEGCRFLMDKLAAELSRREALPA